MNSLETVFHDGRQELRSATSATATFSFTGDVCLVREVEQRLREDPAAAVADVRDALAADYVVGNLETPLSAAPLDPQRGVLASAPDLAPVLSTLGFDAFTLANNHTMDCGVAGLRDTLAWLESRGIAYCGAGETLEQATTPLIVERNGLRIGILAYSQPELDAATTTAAGVAPLRAAEISRGVASLRPQVDVVVVALHEGYEFMHYPRLEFMALCRELAHAGVGLVCGHHPHVLQGMETVENSLILYSLGNFWFDLAYHRNTPETRDGLIAHVTFDRNGPVALRLTPTVADETSRLRVAPPAERQRILQYLKEFSSLLRDSDAIREQNALFAARVMRAVLGNVYNLGGKRDEAGFEKFVTHQIRRDPYLKVFRDYAELIGGYRAMGG